MCKTINNPNTMVTQMADEIRILDDPEIIKVAIDPTRRKILELLRFNNLSVSQMVSILDKDQSTIYRHVEKLQKAGYIEQSGEHKEHHIPEKVFSRTARIFFMAPGVGALSGEEVILQHKKEMSEKISRLLGKMEYIESSDTQVASDELFMEIDKVVSEKIKELGSDPELDFNTLHRLRTSIILIEMQRNEHLKELVQKYTASFI